MITICIVMSANIIGLSILNLNPKMNISMLKVNQFIIASVLAQNSITASIQSNRVLIHG